MGSMSVNQRTPGEVVQIDFMTLEDIPEVLAIEDNPLLPGCGLYLGAKGQRSGHYLVARYKDAVIGYIGVWPHRREGHITNVAVHPQWRNRCRAFAAAGNREVSQWLWRRAPDPEVRVSNTCPTSLSFHDLLGGIRPDTTKTIMKML